jgi:EAL domain-containing protein (putative c-di-GMP-specific phosphodiesterase class I)
MDDIKNEDSIKLIIDLIAKYDIAKNIIFELSEKNSLVGDDIDKTKEFINIFKGIGSEFALDDFGTGYSSFHPLIEFDFDYIKFDQVLIENIYKEPKKYYLCDLLIDFSRRNNLKTIAEYVEDERHEKALEVIGIEYFQGYKYSKPVKDIDSFIQKGE